MSFVRRKTALVAVGALFAFQALAVVGATSAFASGTCQYNASTDTVSVTIDDNTGSTLSVDSTTGAILLDGLACGSATNSNTATIVVLSDTGSTAYHDFEIDENSGDPFNSSISWVVDLTVGLDSYLTFTLDDDQDNSLSVTDDSFNLNGATGELLGVVRIYADGGVGDDTLDGSGLSGTGPEFQAYGYDGNDTITGSPGDDFLAGQVGDDTVTGGDGDDELGGGPGADTLTAGAGDDTVYGGPDADVVVEDSAANGADLLDGACVLCGSADAGDTIDYGARTTDTVTNIDTGAWDSGEDANADGDAVDVGDEGDQLWYFDTFVTGSGNDTLTGSAGDETFIPGDGDDTIDGVAGTDTLDYSNSSAGMSVDVAAGTATGQGADEFSNITDFVGSDFDDTFIDDQAVSNSYTGGDGNDTFDQGADDGTDSDFLDGGLGMDTADYSQRTEDLTVYMDSWCSGGGAECDEFSSDGSVEDLATGSGNDYVDGNKSDNMIMTGDGDDEAYGELGRDWFDLGAGNDYGEGDDGNDTFLDAAGSDVYYGDNGSDTVDFKASTAGIFADMDNGSVTNGPDDDQAYYFENLFGTAFDDTVLGNWSNNLIKGRGGDDNITASGGDDRVVGGAGSDLVRAGNGDDDLYGKGGPDFLYGGGGTDFANGGAGADVCKTEIKVKC